MATAQYYVINPLELPANQAAAALFNKSVIVGTIAQWASSPSQTWPDISTAARQTAATAALRTEQDRQLTHQERLNEHIAQLQGT
jgi:hypothetical protein